MFFHDSHVLFNRVYIKTLPFFLALATFAFWRMRNVFSWSHTCVMYPNCELRSWDGMQPSDRAFYECTLFHERPFSECMKGRPAPCKRPITMGLVSL